VKGDVIRLVILGLLNEGPKHGYSIYREIKHRFGASANVKVGSVYHAVKRLESRGEIEEVGVEENRRIYAITERGRDVFVKLLRKEFERSYTYFDPLRVVMVFLTALPPGEVMVFLRRRLEELEDDFHRICKANEEMEECDEVPWYAGLVVLHSLKHLEAEVQWLKTVLATLERRFGGKKGSSSAYERGDLNISPCG
jgi:DNA-binding PadR family transcriptional regulator